MSLMLSQDAPADSLLERDPLALVLAMLLDQQVPMERAFAAPYELQQRLGHDLDVRELLIQSSGVTVVAYNPLPEA